MTEPLTLGETLLAASRSGHKLEIIEHDGSATSLSYADLTAEALSAGAAFAAEGVQPGAHVVILAPEVGAFIRSFFAIVMAGGVPVPLPPPGQAGDLGTFGRHSQQLILASRASVVVATPEIVDLVADIGLPPHVRLIPTNGLGDGRSLSAPITCAPDAPALLQFTSGSTAVPKGVVLTHRNLLTNIGAIAGPVGLRLTPSDMGVSWLPLYHDMGLIGMLLTAVYRGSPAVIMSPTLFLKRPTSWLEAISTHRATVSFAPNFAYELCVRRVKAAQIASLDLSSWRVAGCGAEPIRPETLSAFAERFQVAGFRASSFVPSYGLAEHSLAVSMSTRGVVVDRVDPLRLGRDSVAVPVNNGSAGVSLIGCGTAFPGHELQIAGEDRRPLTDRHVGRIFVRGPSVMAGYFENDAATQEALAEGWLDTGDLGYMADGSLFVCGRTKDVIIRHGRKYHPPDLESVIRAIDGLRPSGVVVFGIHRVGSADEVVAVLEARASATSDEVVDSVRRRVRETAGLELDRVVVTPPGTIPRTTSGKVRRAEARARLQAGTLLSGGRETRS